MHRLQRRYLVHKLVFACSLAPAANALADQPHYPDFKPSGVPFAQWPGADWVSSQSSGPHETGRGTRVYWH